MKIKVLWLLIILILTGSNILRGQVPEMGLVPDSAYSGRNGSFSMNLQLLSNIYCLKSYSVEIHFDASLIKSRVSQVSEGPLLGGVGAPTFFWVGFSPDSSTLYIDGAILGDGITTGDIGVLASIQFNADPLNFGTTNVEFLSIRARDADNNPLAFTKRDAWARICEYLLGDANGDGEINISDAVFIINYIFLEAAAPSPLMVADANCDDYVNISDAVWIINYIFIQGDPPCRVCW